MVQFAFIEDNVIPQLFTSAIEAYSFKHQSHSRGTAYEQLETFGLLWGYSIPQRGEIAPKIIVTMCTVETSALRHQDWVRPNFESILEKKYFFQRYWPNIELIGSFHSHPYEDLETVTTNQGWRASESDKDFYRYFHEAVSPEQENLLHLIVTITNLKKKGWAFPDRLSGSEYSKGFVLSADNRKIWLRAYSSEKVIDMEEQVDYQFCDDVNLDIPALQRRFMS